MSRRASLAYEAMQAGIQAARATEQLITVDKLKEYLAKRLRISEKDPDWEVVLQEFTRGYQTFH